LAIVSVLLASACATQQSPVGSGAPASGADSMAAKPAPAPAAIVAKVDFNQQVKPFFQAYCYFCHGNGQQRGGVRLDVRANTMTHVIPGDPVKSDVYRAITRSMGASDHMPPVDQDQPTDAEIAMIKQWIIEGANWPDGS
jgi:uncharacterized membrane protein